MRAAEAITVMSLIIYQFQRVASIINNYTAIYILYLHATTTRHLIHNYALLDAFYLYVVL